MRKDSTFLSADGRHTIHMVAWTCENAKGTIQIVHGMNEYIARYENFAKAMNKAGYNVVGHDHLGHGLSVNTPEELGYFGQDGNACLIKDIHTVSENVHGYHILLGHSMGSFLVRQYITLYDDFDKIIIMGSAWQPMTKLKSAIALAKFITKTKGSTHRSKLLHNMALSAYDKPFGPSGWISSDEVIVRAYQNDRLTQFMFTASAYHELLAGLLYAQENMADINKEKPIFIVSGQDDPVGQMGKAVQALYDQCQKHNLQAKLKLYPGMRHEILNEIGKEEVYQDLLEFIQCE